MVVASLESFINEVCLDAIQRLRENRQNSQGVEAIVYGSDGRGMELRKKWEEAASLLHNKKFDKGVNPWQDFYILVNLRNALMHYRSESKEPGYIPPFLESLLRSMRLTTSQENVGEMVKRPPTLSELSEPTIHWTEMVCTLPLGKWAFNTGHDMLQMFLSMLDQDVREDYEILLEHLKIRRMKGC
jgi:hypothetical protein